MTVDDVAAKLHVLPFRPIRIVTTSGEAYEIFRPFTVVLSGREIIVSLPVPEGSGVSSRLVWVDVSHISAIETLVHPPIPAAPQAA